MQLSINLTGGSYSHKSLPISAQVTRNFWPQLVDDPFAKSKYVLESFLGQSLFATISGIGRGLFFHRNILYRVAGTTLYSIDSQGNHTSLGTISGSDRCVFGALGSDIIIIGDRKAYIYNGSTVTQVTDPDLQSPDSVAVLNNQAIYDGNNNQWGVSDVGDASSINGLNYASAESKPDNLIRCYTFNQVLYLFGEETVELWWNSGQGNPPFDKIEGGIIQLGIAGVHAVSNTASKIYFLAQDRRVYEINGTVPSSVSTSGIVREFNSYSDISDAVMWTMDIRNQDFIFLTFPSANKTWVYPEGGQWFEWSSGVNGGRNKANSYAFAYNKHLVEDYQNGNIYELDFDVYTENGDSIVRQRDSAPLTGSLIQAPGKRVFMNKLELVLETGVGLLTGQGSDPEIILSYSDDGGKTFSTEMFGKVGKLGEFQYKVEWHSLGAFYERIIRIKTSDPVYYSISNAFADVEAGI